MTRASSNKADCSIIALEKFILATRDSGYKGTASAISELVDNAIQAGATDISISIVTSGEDKKDISVSVLDNGCGMDPFTLQQALRFGGSTRFGDRGGLGRYGMGLPNASLSHSRRVTVYTWPLQRGGQSRRLGIRGKRTSPDRVYMSYLDIDEIVQGKLDEVPSPRVIKNPPAQCRGLSGTFVVWTQCDRLDYRRVSTIARKLAPELGRRFRHFLWKGVRISINDDPVVPFDPLYIRVGGKVSGARLFGEELRYEISVDDEKRKVTGIVRVRFSELPVHEWHKLSNEEKRRIGVSNGAGISIVRAGREVDYGWFFMGNKRRENYDDWWRCEIQFAPVLDEAFGITHTKQQIRPTAYLLEALTPDLETTARALNARARKAHLAIKAGDRFSEAERVATECEKLLRPLPKKETLQARSLMKELEQLYPTLRRSQMGSSGDSRYRIIEGTLKDTGFYNFLFDGSRLVVLLNPDHPFYRELYKPLADGDSSRDQQLRARLELLLLAAARSELVSSSRISSMLLNKHRAEWSNTLATFLNG